MRTRRVIRIFVVVLIFSSSLLFFSQIKPWTPTPQRGDDGTVDALRLMVLSLNEANAILQAQLQLAEQPVASASNLPHPIVDLRADCSPWTLQSLSQFPPDFDADSSSISTWPFERPLGLGYTVAPVHCFEGLAFDHTHLVNVSQRHDMIFFLHVMKTGGSSLRQKIDQTAASHGERFCKWYNHFVRPGHPEVNYTTLTSCRNKYHVGHLAQNGYHLKFPEFRNRRAFYLLMLRDPFSRALSVYDWFRIPPALLPKEAFLTEPTKYPSFRDKATFWALDLFWYLGVEKIRTSDSASVQLEKVERCKFAIRSMLVLITERFLESMWLLQAALGDRAFTMECELPQVNEFGNVHKSISLNVTRDVTRVAMAKLRHWRVLYEYAVAIFELRLQQFGIREMLQKKCTPAQLEAGGFGQPSALLYMSATGTDSLP